MLGWQQCIFSHNLPQVCQNPIDVTGVVLRVSVALSTGSIATKLVGHPIGGLTGQFVLDPSFPLPSKGQIAYVSDVSLFGVIANV